MEKENKTRESIMQKKFFGTLFFGIIINYVILGWVDIKNDCSRSYDGAFCTPYTFLLTVSLIMGWIVSIVLLKIENKK